MPLRDPFEEAWLKEEAEEAEERSSSGSPRQPHDAPPSNYPSDVPPPPYAAGDGDVDGDGGGKLNISSRSTSIKPPSIHQASSKPMPLRDPFEEACLKEEAEEAEERSSSGSPRQPHDAPPPNPPSNIPPPPSDAGDGDDDGDGGGNEEEQEEEDMEVQSDDFPSRKDPEELARLQAILSTFTEEQMNRYEAFRRSGFSKAKMKRMLTSIVGKKNVSKETNIVVSALAKMFAGDLIETARVVMTERNDSGPIRPCHIRESYRRLKLEGKTFTSTVPRLFR